MRSKDEIKDMIIELYRKLVKSYGDQYKMIKGAIDFLEWVLQEENNQ